MDVLSCLDWANSCFWNLPSISTTFGSACSTIGAWLAAIVYTLMGGGIPYLGRWVAVLGAALGAIVASTVCIPCIPCSLLGGCSSTVSALLTALGYTAMAGGIPYIGRFIAAIGACIGGVITSSTGYLTATCESLIHNLIGIIGSPIVVRAAYVDGCLEEFLKACYELIRHLI